MVSKYQQNLLIQFCLSSKNKTYMIWICIKKVEGMNSVCVCMYIYQIKIKNRQIKNPLFLAFTFLKMCSIQHRAKYYNNIFIIKYFTSLHKNLYVSELNNCSIIRWCWISYPTSADDGTIIVFRNSGFHTFAIIKEIVASEFNPHWVL